MADVVLLGIRRDHHERLTRTGAAAVSDGQGVDPAGFSCADGAADARAVQRIGRSKNGRAAWSGAMAWWSQPSESS